MAALYKRYIPPKPSVPSVASPPTTQAAQIKVAPPQDPPNKRKRERTEDEVAERKAKKLRKKGVDPTTGEISQAPTESVPAKVTPATTTEDVPEEGAAGHQSEFAHVTNKKKRRKLEKQARQQSKAAGQGEQVHDSNSKRSEKDLDEHSNDVMQNVVSTPANAHHGLEQNEDGEVVSQDVNGDLDIAQDGSYEVPEAKKKRRRKDKNLEGTGDGDGVEKTTPIAPSQNPTSDEGISQPRKRRHKLEHVLQNSPEVTQTPPVDEKDHLKKHGSILKKFQQASKLSEQQPVDQSAATMGEDRPKPILIDLAPLPQPEPAQLPEFVPDSGAVPTWIAQPSVVGNDGEVRFDDLKLDMRTVEHLAKLGFQWALPVQKGLIPLLLPPGAPGARFLPGADHVLPDIAVSAPTGSGKTIAYLLPIIESLKKIGRHGDLKALIIVPTRELVAQVAAVADSLARGTHIRVGMATGTGSLKDEQTKLIRRSRQYDPARWRALIDRAYRKDYPPQEKDEDFDDFLAELDAEDPKETQRTADAVTGLPAHIPVYESTCDILVATPGRLMEHLNNTLGFNLAHLQWLILDEADKLLDLQYNDFLERINEEFSRPHSEEDQHPRERYLRTTGLWREHLERRVRKVVLSATMTSDISKLVALKLVRPRMLVVRETGRPNSARVRSHMDEPRTNGDGAFDLPASLDEFCIHVGDGSEKPLFLAELLSSRIMHAQSDMAADHSRAGKMVDHDEEMADDTSSSEEDSSSDSTSSSSESDSDSEDSQSIANARIDHAQGVADEESFVHPSRSALVSHLSNHQNTIPTILIFTSSNESTNRLSHLLKQLKPSWSSFITSMTRSEPQRKVLPHNELSKPVIAVATDRAARGLDALGNRNITHVVQYDVPRSTTAYVHRVGRTARAGRQGEAWTLYTHSEARWFMKDVAKTKKIKRVAEVEKVKLPINHEDDLRESLSKAVDSMRDEVFGRKK